MDRRLLGRLGEQFAREFLVSRNYRILAVNHRTPSGEIDIVARHRRSIVFIEVKTRTGAGYGLPEEAVTSHKLSRLQRSARIWLQKNRYDGEYRFEVLSVLWGENPSCEIVPVE